MLGIGFITEDNLTHLAQIIHDKLEKHEEREVERIGLCFCCVLVNIKKQSNEASTLDMILLFVTFLQKSFLGITWFEYSRLVKN